MFKQPHYRRNQHPNNGFKEKVVWQLSKHPMTGRELSALFHMSLGEFNSLMRGCLRGKTAVITASDPVPVDACTDYTYTLISTKRTTHINPKAIVVSWRAFGMATNDSQRINTEAAQRRARLIDAGLYPVGE
ncbi:hypothetical protein AC790_13320 [Pantoea sp. RIT-PI-b]|uniref:hypothetical protein n=1 Tax=Pantoea sp. RIT-PI-b TaxID=1681195 RepID=UPI000675E975|nr:hypothetical protein [Pantoea sp. RIT-PI-b]KNC11545.1 hypothetical protein AC790_13320 [Pantoea sp. RIT-PI-b]